VADRNELMENYSPHHWDSKLASVRVEASCSEQAAHKIGLTKTVFTRKTKLLTLCKSSLNQETMQLFNQGGIGWVKTQTWGITTPSLHPDPHVHHFTFNSTISICLWRFSWSNNLEKWSPIERVRIWKEAFMVYLKVLVLTWRASVRPTKTLSQVSW
jgi:hypothetical protein